MQRKTKKTRDGKNQQKNISESYVSHSTITLIKVCVENEKRMLRIRDGMEKAIAAEYCLSKEHTWVGNKQIFKDFFLK